MAPEQLADGANVGTAADIHALGAILYECLSGRPAHSGESIQEAMFSVLNKEPPPFEGAPQTLVALSRRCLSKDPTKRPPSARAFAEELSACLDARASDDPRSSREGAAETVAEDGPTPAISIAPVGKRRRRLSLPLTLGVGIILGGLASRQLSTARGDASAQVPSLASSALQRGRPGQATASPPRPAVTASTTAQPATPTASAAAPSIKPRATSPPRLGSSGASTLALSAAPQHAASIGSLDTANPYSE
jgi:serine/threonine-protein kinase